MLDRPPGTSENRWLWRGLAAALILGAAALHVAYLIRNCPLDLAPDEAHYWDWSRHLDWSYYSKGPLVALLDSRQLHSYSVSFSESLTGNLALAIRLPAIVCGVLLLASMYVLTVQSFGRERLAFALVALASDSAAGRGRFDADDDRCAVHRLLGLGAGVRARRRRPRQGVGLADCWPHCRNRHSRQVHDGAVAAVGGDFPSDDAGGAITVAPPGILVGVRYCRSYVVCQSSTGMPTTIGSPFGMSAGRPACNSITAGGGTGPQPIIGGQAALLLGVWFVAWAAAMWTYRPWKSPEDRGPLPLPTHHSPLPTPHSPLTICGGYRPRCSRRFCSRA